MRPKRSRWITSLVVALTLVTGGSSAQAQEPAADGACALLTTDEVGQILGTEVVAGEGASYGGVFTCDWIASDPFSFAFASVQWADGSLDDIKGGLPDGVELTIGDRPGVFDAAFGQLYVGLEGGVLSLWLVPGSPDIDAQEALTQLGELAVPRVGALPAPPAREPVPQPDPDPAAAAFCGLLTPEDIQAVFSGDFVADPSDESRCFWWSTGGSPDLYSLSASWSEMTMADTHVFFPGGEELTVGGLPAWYTVTGTEGNLFIDLDPGVLWLVANMVPGDDLLTPGSDPRDELTRLAELAVPRAGTLPAPPAQEPLPEPESDPIGAAFCDLLTVDEVSGALGGPVTTGSFGGASPGTCSWVGGGIGDFLSLSVSWDTQTPEQIQSIEDVQTLSVGGRPAWFTSDFGLGILYLELDQGLLALGAAASEDVDPQAALTELAELVVPRSSSLVGPPAPPAPPAARVPDPDLEALIPATIGGRSVSVFSASGETAVADLMGDQAGQLEAAIEATVTSQGGSLADVSIAFGVLDFSSSLIALKLEGMDAAAALPTLLEELGMSGTPVQVAGKSVIKGDTSYAYAKDEVIWIVNAEEPALTDLLGALP